MISLLLVMLSMLLLFLLELLRFADFNQITLKLCYIFNGKDLEVTISISMKDLNINEGSVSDLKLCSIPITREVFLFYQKAISNTVIKAQ